MKTYGNFGEMFNAQSGLKSDMSVFNRDVDDGKLLVIQENLANAEELLRKWDGMRQEFWDTLEQLKNMFIRIDTDANALAMYTIGAQVTANKL